MSKLAHSCGWSMAIIERQAREAERYHARPAEDPPEEQTPQPPKVG